MTYMNSGTATAAIDELERNATITVEFVDEGGQWSRFADLGPLGSFVLRSSTSAVTCDISVDLPDAATDWPASATRWTDNEHPRLLVRFPHLGVGAEVDLDTLPAEAPTVPGEDVRFRIVVPCRRNRRPATHVLRPALWQG